MSKKWRWALGWGQARNMDTKVVHRCDQSVARRIGGRLFTPHEGVLTCSRRRVRGTQMVTKGPMPGRRCRRCYECVVTECRRMRERGEFCAVHRRA